MIGRTVSHYRIIGQLGAGGMGVVYRAEDLRLGRPVALKFLPEELAKDQQAIERLRIEARAASALNHTNICTIYDIDEIDGQPFIAMELIKGQTLRERLEGGALKIHYLVDIGIQIADALDASHSQGIVHRDIKPANIFLTERNQIKLLDFGLAKLSSRAANPSTTAAGVREHLTGEGITLGTVSYMSPEQATGEELDGRTDLFSVGVVLYECATGHQPFSGKTSAAILAAIISRAPISAATFNSEIPVRLQEVLNNCLEKDRELRYQSSADLRADLKRVRRDIESGRSDAMKAVVREESRSDRTPPSRTERLDPLPRPEPLARAATSAGPSITPTPAAHAGGRRVRLFAAATMAVAVLAVGSYLLLPRTRTTPSDASPMAALSEATIRNRSEMAAQSFDAKNYRAALAYASEVLAAAPHDAGAAKIRDDSRAMIARFDAGIDEARRRSASGDVTGAAQALDTARSIDPTAPSVTELSARLADQLRSQPAFAASPASRARPAAEPPRPPARAPTEPAGSEPERAAVSAPAPAATSGIDRTPTPSASPLVVPPPSAPEPDARVAAPAPAPPVPALAPVTRAARDPAAPQAPPAEDDEAAIRRVIATYGHAIETKDLALFRTVKPNLSPVEERRLTDGFRAVTSQRVELTILSIDLKNQAAAVQVRRLDVIQNGRQQQTAQSRQTIVLSRPNGGWVIVEIR